MFDEMLDHLVSEKMDYKEYKEIADQMVEEELKGMFMKMSEDEHNHYKMIREYLERKIEKE